MEDQLDLIIKQNKQIEDLQSQSNLLLEELALNGVKSKEVGEYSNKLNTAFKELGDNINGLNEIYGGLNSIKETILDKNFDATNIINAISKVEKSLEDNNKAISSIKFPEFPEYEAPIIPDTISVNEKQLKSVIKSIDSIVIPEFPIKEIVNELDILGRKISAIKIEQPELFDYKKLEKGLEKAVKGIVEAVSNISVGGGGGFSVFNLKNSSDKVINPATEEKQDSLNTLVTILNQLVLNDDKVHVILQQIRDAIRMPVDYNEASNSKNINGTVVIGSGTVTAVTTVGTVTNQTNIGGYSADMIAENNSRQDWGVSIRSLII